MTYVAKTYCRICPGFCAMDATVEDGRVVKVRGDRDDPVSRGYTCIKGLQNPELLYGDKRVRRPLRRGGDGRLTPAPLSEVLDEIADKIGRIVESHGPRSVGIFVGTQGYFSAISAPAASAFAAALGTPCVFGTMTIDQSAKWVANERIGVSNSGPHRFDHSDVWMLLGSNPLVSVMGGPVTSGFNNVNPTKALRDAKARGMRLIVIDPRLTETAKQADLFLQPRPGEDAAVLGGLVHVVLRENWIDRSFCDRYVDGVEALRKAVAEFTPEAVARRADLRPEEIVAAARMFALESRRGQVGTGTGTDMGPHSNIAEHLVQCLNVLCGRFLREGDTVPNPGVLTPPRDFHADVTPPTRVFEQGPRSRRLGLGRINGQMMSAELADEILQPGPGQIRALICLGGNPAVALPHQAKALEALRSLDLLVTIDPRMSATARIADYVVAPTHPFERHDHTGLLEGQYHQPYAYYAVPLVSPPADSEVIDDWKVFWELSRRLGVPMALGDLQAGAEPTPSTEAVLAATLKGSRVPLDEVRTRPAGAVFDVDARVKASRPQFDGRLQLASADVLEEIQAAARTLLQPPMAGDQLLLTVRRTREFMNSLLTDSEESRARISENPAFLHPADMDRRGIAEGDQVWVVSDVGRIAVVARADPSLRQGMVSVPHAWGRGVDDADRVPEATSRLVDSDHNIQSINGMPVMTGVPVRLLRETGAEPEPV